MARRTAPQPQATNEAPSVANDGSGETSSNSAPTGTPAKDRKRAPREEYFVIADGKRLDCGAGRFPSGTEVTEAQLGSARFKSLRKNNTIVTKVRRKPGK